MKHSKIIQENLDKRQTTYEKISYLLYAYKEWVIGITVALLLLFLFSFSILNKKEPDLTVRILTNTYLDTKEVTKLSDELKEKLGNKKLTIDIQNILFNDPSQRQALFAQSAAKQIDLYITPYSIDTDFQSFSKEMVEKRNIFPLEGEFSNFTVSESYHAPHANLIKKLEEQYK